MTKEQEILKKELKSQVLKQLEEIQRNVSSEKGSDSPEYFQMLMLLSDDLDDILLNWED